MADEGKPYLVLWEADGCNYMTSAELGRLPFDFASWTEFFRFVLRRSQMARMVLHQPNGRKTRAKVIDRSHPQWGTAPSFESL